MKAQVLSRRFRHVFTKDCRVVSAQMDSSDEDCQVVIYPVDSVIHLFKN